MDHIEKQGHLTGTLSEQSLRAADWFETLRDEICTGFEAIEAEADTTQLAIEKNRKAGKFERQNWQRDGGGGGQISVMKGRVFEKVGVNISVVHGTFSEAFREQIPGAKGDGSFWAGGISLVAHPQNPFVPAAHMNTRFVVTSKAWFGGGGDLTPIMSAKKEAAVFHQGFQACCDRHHPDYYAKYKKWCDEYFYLKHRDEPRGAGGIFYDIWIAGSGRQILPLPVMSARALPAAITELCAIPCITAGQRQIGIISWCDAVAMLNLTCYMTEARYSG